MTIKQSQLSNGLKVLTNTMPDVETVSMGIYVGSGSRSETQKQNGMAHFIEHMLFKGTKKRDAKQIVEAIESVGGNINAYTSRELTVYHTKSLKEDYETCLDVISDMVQHSTMIEKEFKAEQNVILQEIAQNFDDPGDAVHDDFQMTAYGDHPVGRPILGTNDTIMAMTADDLFGFMRQNYTSSNMVLSAAGNLNHNAFVDKAESYFEALSTETPTNPEESLYKGGEIKTKRDIEQLQLALGFSGTHYGAEDYYDHSVFSVILGGGMSSRLFQEIREKRGLAYSIYSYSNSYQDSGMICINAALNADKANDIVPIISEELQKMTSNMTEEEIMRAKTQIRSSLLMSQESSMSRCEKMGHHMLIHGRVIPIEELIEKIEAVDQKRLEAVLSKMLKGPKTLAALGPQKAIDQQGLNMACFG